MLQTELTQLLGIRYPIIAGPMFLVSSPELVAAVSEAGGLGAMPALNWRTTEEFRAAVRAVKSKTSKPFGVNIIVNQSNLRQKADLAVCIEERVPLVITSLGNPKDVIREMHAIGSKVFCDVTELSYALKVQELGADAVIAVSAGAGGHAGPVSPLVLVPYLKRHLKIPVVAAGGIATGEQLAAVLLLGAGAAQIGTRFIATPEAAVDDAYKNAICQAQPEDILMTKKISGTPVAVIRTPYIERVGLELSAVENWLLKRKKLKKWVKLVRVYIGTKALEKTISGTTWKQVWSAGQGVGLIDKVLPAAEVVERLIKEYETAISRANGPKN